MANTSPVSRRAKWIPYADIQNCLITLANPIDPATGAIGTHTSHSMTFLAEMEAGDRFATIPDGGKSYGVYRNSSWRVLERMQYYLETDNFAADPQALLTSSGRAANELAFKLVPAGSHIVIAMDDLYPGTRKLIGDKVKECGWQITYTDLAPEKWEQAGILQPNTKMVYFEPDTNPNHKIADISAIFKFRDEHRHTHDIILVADSTSLSLAVQPLRWGIDIVTKSLTKFSNGDVAAGVVVINPERKDLYEELVQKRDNTGPILAPEIASHLIQTTKDLPVHTKTHFDNTKEMALWLSRQTEIEEVIFPGLSSHPQHDLAVQQFGGRGSFLAFKIRGGEREAEIFVEELRKNTRLNLGNGLDFYQGLGLADGFATDLSVLNYYCKQSGFFKAMCPEDRLKYGITPNYFRYAVGRRSVKEDKKYLGLALKALSKQQYALRFETQRNDCFKAYNFK